MLSRAIADDARDDFKRSKGEHRKRDRRSTVQGVNGLLVYLLVNL